MSGKKYQVAFAPAAARQFAKLPTNIQKRLRPHIDALAINPRPPKVKKLQGVDLYRIRVGDYRIIFEIQDTDLIVLVVKVADRKEAY